MEQAPDRRRYAPAALRNRQPIADILSHVLPSAGLVLEIASGSGEHAAYFAAAFPDLVWQPSDAAPVALASIDAWRQGCGLANLRAPVLLDVEARDWPIDAADVMLCINMVHISPWAASGALMCGAGRILSPGGLLYLYGPYIADGVVTAQSNLTFDADLRARNPEWGLRRVEDVISLAGENGLDHRETIEMPANNLSVIFTKRS